VSGQDSLKTRRTLNVDGKSYVYYSIEAAGEALGVDFARLPFSLKVLLENLLRFEDGKTITTDDIKALADWMETKSSKQEIAYRPARVLLQDFTGVPAVVDLAAMRDARCRIRRIRTGRTCCMGSDGSVNLFAVNGLRPEMGIS
jgi:aconitate hydratase